VITSWGILRLLELEGLMKTILTSIVASSLLAALAIAQPKPRYTVTDLGTLGTGNNSSGLGMNNAGWVAGSSNLAAGGFFPQHAFLWYGGGPLHDLGTLGGANSEAGGLVSGSGEVAIISDTSTYLGPTGEDFCGFGTHHQCLGAIWKNGALRALPTLKGGHNGQAYNLNNRGQVIGFSENGTSDPTCSPSTPFQVFDFEAVIWGPNGEIQELPPLKGDTVGFAFGINDNGQVVGTSGLCSNTSLPPLNPSGPHAVLWEKDGSPTDLGSLGGTMFNIATSVNNRGDVAGTSQYTDGTIHSFLWTKHSGIQDLGIFPGGVVTVAPCCNTINDRGEVVGFSIDGTTGNSRAFFWQNGVMYDLNALIPAGSPWYLQAAESINDAGEIVGYGLINGEIHAFLATPR
jgi:probable HAF family extracellular repeat protein